MGILCTKAALDYGYFNLAVKGCLKIRMRKSRTSGSVRGSMQAFHIIGERYVEMSTRQEKE